MPFSEDSHLTMAPVCVPKVKTSLELPMQMCAPPVTVPATVAGSTTTVVATEFASAQTPLLTTALNWVVAVNVPEV